MMARSLYVEFTEARVRSIITLNEDNAPVTCATIWEALVRPIRSPALHAMFAGPEIMLGLPPEAQTFDAAAMPAENQDCFPKAGECLWFYQRKNLMKGLADELWEIGIFYGDGGRVFGPLGWTPVNIFGRITENLEGFQAECAKIRWEGAKTVELGRNA
ncbi:MAG: DUF3830 family protein [Geminicoccaceae bacterium]|nr:DUF3830 family protein [Geminicoccaceae bacterium]